jgi:hypothetical protein
MDIGSLGLKSTCDSTSWIPFNSKAIKTSTSSSCMWMVTTIVSRIVNNLVKTGLFFNEYMKNNWLSCDCPNKWGSLHMSVPCFENIGASFDKGERLCYLNDGLLLNSCQCSKYEQNTMM